MLPPDAAQMDWELFHFLCSFPCDSPLLGGGGVNDEL